MQCLKYGWKQGGCMKRSKNSLVCVCVMLTISVYLQLSVCDPHGKQINRTDFQRQLQKKFL